MDASGKTTVRLGLLHVVALLSAFCAGQGQSPEQVQVDVLDDVTSFTVVGPSGLVKLTPQDHKVAVPPGEYKLAQWEMTKLNAQKIAWTVVARVTSQPPLLTAVSGQSNEWNLGTSRAFNAKVDLMRSRDVILAGNPRLEGPNREKVQLSWSGKGDPPLPKLLIENADKTYKQQLSFSYG